MVKIMQKHAKLEQKVEKAENHENPPKLWQPVDWMWQPVDWIKLGGRSLTPEANMSTGWRGKQQHAAHSHAG